MPTVDDAGDGRKAKRARRAPAASKGPAAAATQLRMRTAEEIATEQTIERLAVRIWTALVAQKILGDMSAMLDALIDSHLFTDSDEEADEGGLDDSHKREKEILDDAISEALDAYPDIAAIADIPDSSDPSIAGDIKQLKDSLEKCAVGATKIREKFSRATLEQLIRRKQQSLLKENSKYREHMREEVPGAKVERYGDVGRTSTAGTFVKSAGYVDGGGLDTLLTGGWLCVAKDRIDPVALSHLHGFARNTERQRWRHHFVITATARNGEQSPFWLAGEDLVSASKVVRALKQAGVRIVSRKGSYKALARFMNFRPPREIVRMPRVGWAQIGKHWVFVRPDEVITPPEMLAKKNVSYELDAAAKQHGLHVAGTAKAWATEIAAPLRGNSNVALSFATFFAAPLLCWASEPGGGVHLFGKSSIGKTMASDEGQSIYGWPHELGDDAFGTSWEGTTAGFDALALARTDLGLPMDEITLADRRTAEAKIYKIASGTKGPRATSTGQLRETAHASVLVFSTGEKSLTQFIPKLQVGAQKRLVDVPAEVQPGSAFETIPADQIDSTGKLLFDAMRRQHGAVGRDWQHHLVELGPDQIKTQLAQHRKAFLALAGVRDVDARAHPQARAVINRFAVYVAALRMAVAAKLLPWTVEETDAGIVACMRRWMTQRGNVDTAGEIVRIVQQVERELIAGLAARYIHIHRVDGKWAPASPDDELRQRTPEQFDGYAKPDRVLVRPEAWKRYTNGWDAFEIAKQFKQRGALITSGAKMSKSEQVIDRTGRFYVLVRSALTP